MVQNLEALKNRMNKVAEALQGELAGLRTGRANAAMLDPIQVEAYGTMMPLTQLAGISVPESRILMINVWDAGLVKAVEKAIAESRLGLNPQTEGASIRLVVPELNEERRKELTKIAGGYGEQARIKVRTIRREGIESWRKAEKKSEISKDELHRQNDEIQALTDETVKTIDLMVKDREKEIMNF